jgi:hypothetical protein
MQLSDTNQMLDYTSPVYFWTNIELSLAVVSSCLPTLRPIWTYFRPAKPSTGRIYNDSAYKYGGSGKRSDKFTSDQYTELDDIEGSAMGVDTTIRAAETQTEGDDRDSGRSTTGQPEGRIVIRTSLETSSMSNILDNRV